MQAFPVKALADLKEDFGEVGDFVTILNKRWGGDKVSREIIKDVAGPNC